MAAFTFGIAFSSSVVRGHIRCADGKSTVYHFK